MRRWGWVAVAWLAAMLAPRCVRAQTEYRPPAAYFGWYRDVLECSGVVYPAVRFEDLRFFAVPDSSFTAEGRGGYIGYTYPAERAIVVVQDSIHSRVVVAHELLHAILGKRGHGPMFAMCGLTPNKDNLQWPLGPGSGE